MKWLLTGDNLIGDVLMQTPAIRALKQARPNDAIHYLSGSDKGTYCLLSGNPYLSKVMECWNQNIKGVCAKLDEQAALLADEYDRVVRMDCSRAFSWGSVRGGTLAEGFGPQLGVTVTNLHYDLQLAPEEAAMGREAAQALAGDMPYAIIGRHSASCTSNDPTIRVPNKCLANAIWVQVAEWLLARRIMPIAVGAKEDLQDDRYSVWPGRWLYGRPLPELGGAIQGAAVVVSVDTGIRHMAAALGANLYCLSGAIPLSLIHCAPHPGYPDQQLFEEFRPLPYATARAVIAGTERALNRKETSLS